VTFLVGDIYLGINTISGEEVTIKLESVKAKHSQLEYESKVYKTLAGSVGVPSVRWFGTECDYSAMVIDLLGSSLKDLFNFCNRKFTFKTVLLADQLVCGRRVNQFSSAIVYSRSLASSTFKSILLTLVLQRSTRILRPIFVSPIVRTRI
jgi:hypothetical protein